MISKLTKRLFHLQTAQGFMLLGLGMITAATVGVLQRQEPFTTYFFLFVWAGYILFIDGWVYRSRGESLILSHPRRFLFFSFLSVPVWFVFEGLNFRLNNWSYWNLPSAMGARWAGYLLAFSTVIPGLMETADLLDTSGLFKNSQGRPWGQGPSVRGSWVRGLFFGVGLVSLILPLVWPLFFFPLVWGAFFFLAEPLNDKWGGSSLLEDWREGKLRRSGILVVAGLLCGILWEGANAVSGARWTYSLPWAGSPKIFELPFWGYLGFPPFALAVFSLSALAVTFWNKSSRPVKVLFVVTLATFSLGLCRMIDRLTVSSFAG
jgi:hypothetical protein